MSKSLIGGSDTISCRVRIFRNLCAFIVGGLLIGTGCAPKEYPFEGGAPSGRVVLLPGIQSEAWILSPTIQGFRDAGLTRDIEVIEWGSHFPGGLQNLMSYETNRQRASDIAEKIATHRREHPDTPITLVGYSGGGGLAVFVAEALPQDVQLERLILIAAAISPTYDLSTAIDRTAVEVLNLYSPRDRIILGLGTSLFGTMDRSRVTSAGLVGFQDSSGNALRHDKLRQIGWSSEWRAYGHNGSHTTWLSKRWAANVLAGLIDPRVSTHGQ